MKDSKGNIIQSVSRAIDILRCFDGNYELGVTEISKLMGLHKSTTFGLISTLEAHKLLERCPESNKYKLGIELYRLGVKVRADLKTVVRPYLERLVEQHQETVHLGIPDGTNVLYLDKIESPHSMRISSSIGARLPLYCTGVGKVILAYLPEEEMQEIVSKTEFIKYTDNTITDKDALLQQLKVIRLRGYSEDMEELEIGLRCVATPIFDYNDKVIGAISISGPAIRMTDVVHQRIIKNLKDYTIEISEKLGSTIRYKVASQD